MLLNKVDLRLDLDTRCNLRCHYCDNSSLDPAIKVSFPLDQFRSVFQFAEKNCWSLFLSCAGEPLMNSKFVEIMDLLRQTVRSPDVSMVTNALALNETHRQQILNSPIDRLFISMDSLSPEIYTRWCGVSVEQFQRVVENIEAFAEAREKQKHRPHLIVTAIAMKDTLEGLPDIARWLKRLKASAFNIQWLNSMNHDYLRKEQLDLNNPAVAARVHEVLAEVEGILKGSGVLLDYPHTVSREKLKSVWRNRVLWRNKFSYFVDLFRKLSYRRRGLPCRFATNTFYLWPNGHLKGCPADGFETGNIFDGTHSMLSEMDVVKAAIKEGRTHHCESCLFKVE